MPQNEHIEEHIRRHGRRFDHEERKRKREARLVHERSAFAQKVTGLRAKLYHKKRHSEKIEMKKKISMHEEKKNKHESDEPIAKGAIPSYLMDRKNVSAAKVLSNTVKQKRKEKAGKWDVPLPKVRGMSEEEVFKPVTTGKKKGENFTRKPPKFERFIRPSGLRMKKAHVTHPELKATFCLDILAVKKNPSSPMYTSLGVLTRGTIIEVNVSDLGLVTQSGKIVWGKYAQITNNPENDGKIKKASLTLKDV